MQVASASQVPADPKVQSFVQKNAVLLPSTEHSGAVEGQVAADVQNMPTPSGSPWSPGSPHVEKNASVVFASIGFELPLPHAAMTLTRRGVHMLRICCERQSISASSSVNTH